MPIGQLSTTKVYSLASISLITSTVASSQYTLLASSTANKPQSDDSFLVARPCLSSWVSYWKTRILAEIKEEREIMSMLTSGSSTFSTWSTIKFNGYCSRTFVVTSTSTLIEPVPTECGDGIPRGRSIGESVITYTTTAPQNMYCLNKYKSRLAYDEEQYTPPVDVPRCRLPEAQCSESWKYFNRTFADCNYIGANTTGNFDTEFIPKTEEDWYCLGLDRFFSLMAGWTDHLFVNCSQVLPYLRWYRMETAYMPKGFSPNELDRWLDQTHGCEIQVDQFVLLYFDLGIPKNTRYLCQFWIWRVFLLSLRLHVNFAPISFCDRGYDHFQPARFKISCIRR